MVSPKQKRFPRRLLNRTRAHARTLKVQLQSLTYRGLSPRQVFERIYSSAAWGSGNGAGDYDSGTGSTDVLTQAYVETIRSYIRTHHIRRIVDLGCGDFRVGQQLIKGEDWDYTGVDIVRALRLQRSDR